MKSGSRGTGKDTENWSFSWMVVDGLQESIGSIINWGQLLINWTSTYQTFILKLNTKKASLHPATLGKGN